MKRSTVLFGVMASVLMLTLFVALAFRDTAVADEPDGKPLILKNWPTGPYEMKLSDGSTISAIRALHVFRCQDVNMFLVTTGDPHKPISTFVNPSHVVTLQKVAK